MTEPRERLSEAPEADPVRRRVRQKTTPAFATFEALGGSDEISYEEALQKSSQHLIVFSSSGTRTEVGDDSDWITTHWKSSSQRRRADMGDPRAVDADMVELIAANANVSEGHSSRTQATADELLTFAACVEDFSIEISINLEDINVDDLERQPEIVFGNLVKRRAEVKASTLSPQRNKELAQAKDKEVNTWMEHAVVEAAARKGIPPAALMKMRWVVTTKADDSLKARLVVQGFTDTRLGKIQTTSPTSSRRARQVFLLHFQCHK